MGDGLVYKEGCEITKLTNRSDNIHAFKDLAKNNMTSIKPAGDDSANKLEDLAIRIGETRELHVTNELGSWQGFINIY
jgi:hypothetical protein